jgi:hypothetical protein
MVRLRSRSKIFMRPIKVPTAILAIALSGCVVAPELLNSERIKMRFGSYGIDLLSGDDALRRANLYSLEDGRKICRTYAIVRFDNAPAALIGEEHAQIVDGASIGATFKANGWNIYKETRYVGQLGIDADQHPAILLMQLDSAQTLAVHVYRLLLKKGSHTVDYSTIIELHHPEYLDRLAVDSLYVVDEPARLTDAEWQEVSDLVLGDPTRP